MSKHWRVGLLTLVVFGLFSTAVSIWSLLTIAGNSGVFLVPTATPFAPRVSFVEPRGPAARAGVRVGDVLELRALSPAQRFEWQYSTRAGEQYVLALTRHGGEKTVTIRAAHLTNVWATWMVTVCELWMLVFSALIAWRRSNSAHARVLAMFLALFPIAVDWFPSNTPTPFPALNLVLGITMYSVGFSASMVLLAGYAALFGRPLTLMRRCLTYAAYTAGAINAGLSVAQLIGSWTATLDPNMPLFSSALSQFVLWIGLVLFPLLCAFATIRTTRGAERGRVLWATLTIGAVYLAAGVIPTFKLIAPALFLGPSAEIAFAIQNTTLVLAPLGMCYAVFNRRLVDFGFVLNRAAIFSGVSIIIVGLFVLAEWALSEWTSRASHDANIAVSAGLALTLGLSIRFVHAKVEHIVDYVMFRKRREDEEAIRKMAREAPYITDVATMLERVRQTLMRHAGASFADVLLDDGRGQFGAVNENDPALVTLRAEHARLDLHATQTAIEGEWAYPMVARGRLVGALVLGPKQSQESYAPDESAAIAQLAHSVAGALDVLSMQTPADALDAIRASLDTVADAVAAQGELLRSVISQAGAPQ